MNDGTHFNLYAFCHIEKEWRGPCSRPILRAFPVVPRLTAKLEGEKT